MKKEEVKIEFKQPNYIGKDDDGFYKGIVEQIELSKGHDTLDICNRRRNLWLSIFNGYKQLGQFPVNKPHTHKEGDLVLVEKSGNIIVAIKKETITISNINELFKD